MTGTKSTTLVSSQRAFFKMKTSTHYIPVFFAVLFISCLLTYAFLDPGFKGFYVEIGAVAPTGECGDAENFVLEVVARDQLRLNGKAVDQRQLLQGLQKAFQHRPERVVYILAARDVTVRDVVT